MPKRDFSMDLQQCGINDPQTLLGQALENDDLNGFRRALDIGADPTALDEKNTSVFETALKTPGKHLFIEECLRHGANGNFVNVFYNKAAINYAATSKDPDNLEALLRSGGINVDRKYAEMTAVNSLAKSITEENVSNIKECIRVLVRHGASLNIPDQREMTPVLYVLKNAKLSKGKRKELVEMFLEAEYLDLDSFRNGEARVLLNRDYPEIPLPDKVYVSYESLVRDLKHGQEKQFLKNYQEYQLNLSEKDNLHNASKEENLALLLEAIKMGLHEAFETLLDVNRENINGTYKGNTAVHVATSWGNWKALEKLLKLENLKIRRQDQLLITAIRKMEYSPRYEFVDYKKCFELLLDSNLVDINETDPSGTTALHYAVVDRNTDAIRELLRKGAYIGVRSEFGDLPIQEMNPEILEEHFNNCISTNGLKCGEANFEICINYKNLIPPASGNRLTGEMTPIAFIADSKEHRPLLQHPLITSFLFLKWHRLTFIFYLNFFLYSMFALSLIIHTILKYRASEHDVATAIFGTITWIGIVYLMLRELLQCLMSPLKYFTSPVNYMEIVLIVLSIITCSEPTYDKETQRAIAVLTILLVSLDLCLLVGSLPILSISTHMLMLRAVTKSFLKSFTLYSIFVITFSLCFYILFGKIDSNDPAGGMENSTTLAPTEKMEGKAKDDQEEEENNDFNQFTSPLTAVIKTIVMLTGEFDAGDLQFKTLYSYLLFLLFVVFMSIVLFNLLNGLAVSDTQAIKAQAELNGTICRVNLLTRYEEVLTGRSGKTAIFINHEPFRSLCRGLINLHPNYSVGRQIAILPNNNNKVMIPLPKSNTKGLVNGQYRTVALDLEGTEKKYIETPCCFPCVNGQCSEMDTRTVKMALNLIEQKTNAHKERKRLHDTERRLQNIEKSLGDMFEILRQIQENQ